MLGNRPAGFQLPPHFRCTVKTMPQWLNDIHVLLTSRVPIPRMLFLFSVVTLSLFTLSAHHAATLAQVGLILPVMCALFGHLAVISVRLPSTIDSLERIGMANPGGKLVLILIAGYAGLMALPTLSMAQSALSLGVLLYLFLFMVVFYLVDDGSKISWFARDWDDGKRNAANWHVIRLVSVILLNEIVAKHGTPFDWIIAITLGPICLHYLMYWTIYATHPHDNAGWPD